MKKVKSPAQRIREKRDSRINAPLISWQVMIVAVALIVALMVGESVIIAYLKDYLPAMIGILTNYGVIFCFALVILFSLMKRYVYGKSINRIARAARKVARGDYSVRIAPIRRDGKKDEIEVLIEDFNLMAEALGSVEMLKSDFISNVSHEIKTPLAVIQSYATAIKDETLSPEERNAYADTMIDASRRLTQMITNILRLNKMEQQQTPPVGQPFQLGEQLRFCALGQMEAWQEKDIDFAIDVEDTLVCYDESLLELVWNNLIANAVKFSPNGGRIELTSREEAGRVIVRLRDEGCGMTDEVRRRIFDKFYQGDPSHATKGNGLGLAIVKRVLELLGGGISVESAPGEGSVFTVILEKNPVREEDKLFPLSLK